jgi:HEAT repeat protein
MACLAAATLFHAACRVNRNTGDDSRSFRLHLENLNSSDERTRMSAEKHILQRGTNCMPNLIGLLKEDEDMDLAVRGFKLLGQTAESAVPQLETMLSNSKARVSVATSLAFVGGAGVDALVTNLKSSDSTVRAVAALGLSVVQETETNVVFSLVEALNDAVPVVRTSAASSLGKLKLLPNVVVLPLAKVAVNDSNQNTRFAALRSIGAFGVAGREALQHILTLTNDPDRVVREAASSAIRKIGNEAGSE